jgi:hypothetical protein
LVPVDRARVYTDGVMSSPFDRRRLCNVASHMFKTFAIAALIGASISRPTHAAVGPRDRRLTSLAAGIVVEAPAGWTLSQHTGYRDTLVLLLHPDGSRISVTAAMTPARTAAELFRQNLPGLNAAGMRVLASVPGARGALIVDLGPAAASTRDERLRQSYLVRAVPGGWQAIVLTLVCRDGVFAARTPALDFVQTRMGFDDPAPAGGELRSLGGLPAAGGSGGRTGAAGGDGNTPTEQPDKR